MPWRLKIFFLRLFNYLITFPNRLLLILKWFFWITPLRGRHKIIRWHAGLILLIADISLVPLIYETILDLIKWKTRPLTATEKEILFSVFGDSIKYNLIGVDPRSIPAIRRKTVAYVSFHTINFDTEIQDSTLVHEMVHVWQYQKYGAAYISEAFWAQRWGGGYNYGGLEALKKQVDGPGLLAFNFEQQADIIEDYFRWSNDLALQWERDANAVGEVLTKYVRQIRGN